jgi:hypothetical protein
MKDCMQLIMAQGAKIERSEDYESLFALYEALSAVYMCDFALKMKEISRV